MTDVPAKSPQLAQGSELDGWIIESMLGVGGMGVVYQATHSRSGVLAALKVLPESSAASTEVVQRFRREVRTLARVRHPNVVNVLQEALDNLPPYFVMELVPGGSLASKIEEAHAPGAKGFSPAFLAQLARELVEGLGAAHAEHVVHRDVKPQNVLFTSDGHAKIADFGMAKALDLTGLTIANRVMGTLPYMAPESLKGQPADERTDFYQLGVTLFEACTGKRPYNGETLIGVLADRPLPPLPRLAELAPGMPRWMQGVLDRLSAFRPQDRYATATEVLEDIDKGTTAPRRVRSLDTTVATPAGVPPLAKPKPSAPLQRRAPSRPSSGITGRHLVPWALKKSLPFLVPFVLGCALLAWHLRHRQVTVAVLPAAHGAGIAPRPAAQPPRPAPPRASAELPTQPVVVELPDALVAFGRGAAPPVPPASGDRALRVTAGGGLWQAALSTEFPPSTAERAAIASLLGSGSDALLMRLSARPSNRFGDELNMREIGSIESQFYPHIRAAVSQRLGLGVGRIVVTDVPSDELVKTLVGPAEGPPWLELQVALPTVPYALPAWEARLAAAVRLMEPALEGIVIGRDLNTDGWLESPEKFDATLEPVRRMLRALFPSIWVGPGSLDLPPETGGAAAPDAAATALKAFVKMPIFRLAQALELHVEDCGGRWLDGLAAARKAAAVAGLEELPWDVYLQRLPKTSPRYAAHSFAGDDIEMRELLRSMARAVAAGVRRLWFGALRETLQGPLLIDVFAASVGGKVIENEGSGARAFRYVTSRLSEAKPAREPLPGGVQGVALDLPDRRIWFLWAPDGAHRWVQVPAVGAAALVVRVCPVAAWNQTRNPPVQVTAARDGMLAADIDDGLTAIEELPRQSDGSR